MSWSLSALGTYEKCPASYKFRYIDKVPTPAAGGAAARGTELHGAIEHFLTGKTETLPNEINFYTQYLNELKKKAIFPEHRIALKRDWTPTGWDSEDRWYKGILDLKAIESPQATEATVIDWKTGKIYDDHDDQKTIYSLAVFAEHPSVQRVRAVHVYLDLGKNREKVFSRDEVHQLRLAWEQRVERMDNDHDYIPNPSFKCRYCPYAKDKGGPCRF